MNAKLPLSVRAVICLHQSTPPVGKFFCLDGVLHSIHDLCSLRVIETLHRADKLPGDAPDTPELHTLACLPAFNAESIPRPAWFAFSNPVYSCLLNYGGDCLPSLSLS